VSAATKTVCVAVFECACGLHLRYSKGYLEQLGCVEEIALDDNGVVCRAAIVPSELVDALGGVGLGDLPATAPQPALFLPYSFEQGTLL
jgi:hypothetical protein